MNPEPFKKTEKVETPSVQAALTPAVVPQAPAQSGVQMNVMVSDMDAYILDTFKSQPKTLQDVEAIVVETPKDGRHRLSLPEELESYKKKYAFCWIYKRKRAIDEARNLYYWVICNKTHFPEVAEKRPSLFTSAGAIEQGDEILAFRTHQVDKKMREAPGIESRDAIKNRIGAHSGDATYYTPEPEFERGPDGKLREIPVVGV